MSLKIAPRGYSFSSSPLATFQTHPSAITASHSRPQTLSEAIAAASGKLLTGLPSETDNFAKLQLLQRTVGDIERLDIGIKRHRYHGRHRTYDT